jgi:hypothetical protein
MEYSRTTYSEFKDEELLELLRDQATLAGAPVTKRL